MSDKKAGLGLFINKKSAGPTGPAAAAGPVAAPKDVKKRWMYVGIGVVGLVVVSSSLFGNKSEPLAPPQSKKATAMVNTEPPNGDKQAFQAQYGQDLAAIKAEQERMKAQLAAKDAEIKDLRNGAKSGGTALPEGIVAPPEAPNANTGGLQSVGKKDNTPPPPPTMPVRATTTGAPAIPQLVVPPTLGGNTGAATLPPMTAPQGDGSPMEFAAPERSSQSATPSQPSVAAKTRYKKNDAVGMLPAGAFAPVALLNGVDAGTSTATQNNPMPILFQITDQATLPGAAKYRLKSCFVLGTAYGDMSAERVYGRISRLSCVDKADRLVLSQEVQGYLVDSDGKLGLRGAISDRQGAKLGKALLAGFAQGLAGALGQAQGTVFQSATTGTTTSSITGGAAARAAGLTGAQTATSQLAEFYLKEAQAIFPVITVDAGRTGTIVFSSATTLSWTDNDNQYVPQVTPTN